MVSVLRTESILGVQPVCTGDIQRRRARNSPIKIDFVDLTADLSIFGTVAVVGYKTGKITTLSMNFLDLVDTDVGSAG